MSPASLALGFLAGVLSILSPCVLPLLPLVFGAAAGAHRWGPAALAAGLVASFVAIGLFVATAGFALGLDQGVFRAGSAVLLAGLGLVLLSSALQARFGVALAGVERAGGRLMGRMTPEGWGGQALLGVVLGAVWSPCVGPTLGAASLLAAQGRDLGGVAAVMAAFGLGTALPLALAGLASRRLLLRWRGGLLRGGAAGRVALGGMALAVAVLILSGLDRHLETAMVAASPGWLTDLTTRY
jgi:cytochrome c biogenesis protein CcdA